MRRAAASLGMVLAGWVVAQLVHLQGVTHTSVYLYLVATLLAVGLFASTYGINLHDARQQLRLVLLAVTIGVVAKAALISLAMIAVFHRPEYLVFGVAVAQIDPLSIAAQRLRARMSKGADAVLRAWASFDDPVTILLTIYLSAVTFGLIHEPGSRSLGGDLLSFGTSVLGNAGFAAAAFLLWRLLQWLRRRPSVIGRVQAPAWAAVEIILLVLLFGVAIRFTLLLGLAVAGLFYRPAITRLVGIVTTVAFYAAAIALGFVLVAGIHMWAGLILGLAAYGGQVLVGWVLAHGQPRDDRWYLALAQQNGITAVILALLLEADFPGSVGTIAPAILVINLLNAACNTARERYVLRREPVPTKSQPKLVRPKVLAGRQLPSSPLRPLGRTAWTWIPARVHYPRSGLAARLKDSTSPSSRSPRAPDHQEHEGYANP